MFYQRVNDQFALEKENKTKKRTNNLYKGKVRFFLFSRHVDFCVVEQHEKFQCTVMHKRECGTKCKCDGSVVGYLPHKLNVMYNISSKLLHIHRESGRERAWESGWERETVCDRNYATFSDVDVCERMLDILYHWYTVRYNTYAYICNEKSELNTKWRVRQCWLQWKWN